MGSDAAVLEAGFGYKPDEHDGTFGEMTRNGNWLAGQSVEAHRVALR